MATIEKITETLELGEGPHWDSTTQSLYFVDIYGKAIHRYVPATKKHTKAVIDGNKTVSLIIPVENQKNKFLISTGRELVTVDWDGVSEKVSNITKICEVENTTNTNNNQFNDGKCDPTGRLWAGTMCLDRVNNQFLPNNCSLYSLVDSKGSVKKHLTDITISNGLAWDLKLKKMYYIDTPKKTVQQFDMDFNKGTISNCQIIFSLEKHQLPGAPDGMAIDQDGNLWIAVFGGSQVIKIDPRKPETLLETIKIPAEQVTSVAFGGPNLDELYVTSGWINLDGTELLPDNGATFKITGLGAKGLPGVSVKL